MKTNVRTDIATSDFIDVRFIEHLLKGKFDNIYLIFTTLENEPTDAWQDQGDSFLLINIPKERIIDASVDYKTEIINNIPKLSWLQPEELLAYIRERWN